MLVGGLSGCNVVCCCVLETLSDGLGLITMDEQHEERRRRIRTVKSGTSSGHLVAGLKGLGFGLIGGFTSVFKQTYEGASSDGVQVYKNLNIQKSKTNSMTI